MFLKQRPIYPDLSSDLADSQEWQVKQLKLLEFPQNIAAFAIEPVSGLLAVGTNDGIIQLFGAPGVECKLILPEEVPVNLLYFATHTLNLLCVDRQNQLHVWDLSSYGHPAYVANARFNQINSVCVSPSLSHVFFALQSGDVKTYDLACLRKSSYELHSMWELYQRKKIAHDVPLQNPLEKSIVDIVIHPRNLDAMFVAYGGGVVLVDISQRNSRRVYELILPPGAPGGRERPVDNITTQRHPTVTAIAIHPTGHIFAVGYDDGSIAFWATEDDDQPVLVRTLSKLDVNLVDAEILEAHLEGKVGHMQPQLTREPIFKLSWSGLPNSEDPRGGSTVLTILGGLVVGQETGVSVMILRPLSPPDPPTSESTSALHPVVRAAIRDSLNPIRTSCFYETAHPVQDYLLIPRNNSYFSGSFDPYAILLLTETTDGNRVVHGYSYPPSDPSNVSDVTTFGEAEPPTEINVFEYQVIKPMELTLPFSLSVGCSSMLGGMLVSLDREVYEIFTTVPSRDYSTDIILKGGSAWLDVNKANEIRFSKYQPPRMLVTFHQDLTIQFHDMSSQLYISQQSESIQRYFPEDIHELAIDLKPLLANKNSTNVSIIGIEFAEESFEIAVALSNGEIVFYRPVTSFTLSQTNAPDKEIKMISEDYLVAGRTNAPYFSFNAEKGHPIAIAMSNIGFAAISYEDGALYIIDMRGPRVLLRPAPNPKRHKKTPSVTFGAEQRDPIRALSWVVCPLAEANTLQVRLISARASGAVDIYTILHDDRQNTWIISGEPLESKGISAPLHDGCFVIDAKTGAPCSANKARLASSLCRDGTSTPRCILVLVGLKGAKTYANVTGERIGKVEWGHKFGLTKGCQIIERFGHHALFVFNEQLSACVYSLPHLECLHTIQLSIPSSIALTVDPTGDFIAFQSPKNHRSINSMVYGTVFGARRIAIEADLNLTSNKWAMLSSPEPVSLGPASMLGTWFNLKKSMSGDQIDDLLGGPNRPVIKKQSSSSKSEIDNSESSSTNMAGNMMAAASAAQSNLYSRLTSALGERGQLLGDLEDRFNSLEEGSKNMVAQAKRLAAQQTAKGWFGM